MENMIREENETKYVVKVNGQTMSPPRLTRQMAQDDIKHLSEAHQAIAVVVPVTQEGKEILFG